MPSLVLNCGPCFGGSRRCWLGLGQGGLAAALPMSARRPSDCWIRSLGVAAGLTSPPDAETAFHYEESVNVIAGQADKLRVGGLFGPQFDALFLKMLREASRLHGRGAFGARVYCSSQKQSLLRTC